MARQLWLLKTANKHETKNGKKTMQFEYPLEWPAHIPRTPEADLKDGAFGKKGNPNQNGYAWKQSLTIPQARDRLMSEIRAYSRVGKPWRIDPDNVVISTNMRPLNSGKSLHSNQRKLPANECGVSVWFVLDGEERVLAINRYRTVADNIAAIAAVLSAMRTIERHDAQSFSQAFSGFTALPGPEHVIARSWRDVLDYYGNDYREALAAYREARSRAHPDKGGDAADFNAVEAAWGQAIEDLKQEQGS